MKTLLDAIPRKVRCKSPAPSEPVGTTPEPSAQGGETIQLIYAHLPPASVLAAEQHLRSQTQIEQRTEQLWFARHGRPATAWIDWLQKERKVVQKLCAALQKGAAFPVSPNIAA